MVYIQHEIYSSVKKKEIMKFAGKCMESEKLNNPDQERQTLHVFSLEVCSSKSTDMSTEPEITGTRKG